MRNSNNVLANNNSSYVESVIFILILLLASNSSIQIFGLNLYDFAFGFFTLVFSRYFSFANFARILPSIIVVLVLLYLYPNSWRELRVYIYLLWPLSYNYVVSKSLVGLAIFLPWLPSMHDIGTLDMRLINFVIFVPVVLYIPFMASGYIMDDKSALVAVLLKLFRKHLVLLALFPIIWFTFSWEMMEDYILSDVSLSTRYAEAIELWDLIKERPFLGHGMNLKIHTTSTGIHSIVKAKFSHISVLWHIGRLGIIGFLLVFLPFLRTLFRLEYYIIAIFLLDSLSGNISHPASAFVWGIIVAISQTKMHYAEG